MEPGLNKTHFYPDCQPNRTLIMHHPQGGVKTKLAATAFPSALADIKHADNPKLGSWSARDHEGASLHQ
eukprot:1916798-Pyramimonas_sp.AAC.1